MTDKVVKNDTVSQLKTQFFKASNFANFAKEKVF